jgi:hypothetical protein
VAREVRSVLRLVQRFQHQSREPLRFVHTRKLPFNPHPRLIGSPKSACRVEILRDVSSQFEPLTRQMAIL